jgi:hypothetical protein
MSDPVENLPSLAELAKSIRAKLDEIDKAEGVTNDIRLEAGRLLTLAKARVRAEHGRTKNFWADWCKSFVERTPRDIQRLVKMASPADPKAAREEEKKKARDGMKAKRLTLVVLEGSASRIDHAQPTPPKALWDQAAGGASKLRPQGATQGISQIDPRAPDPGKARLNEIPTITEDDVVDWFNELDLREQEDVIDRLMQLHDDAEKVEIAAEAAERAATAPEAPEVPTSPKYRTSPLRPARHPLRPNPCMASG